MQTELLTEARFWSLIFNHHIIFIEAHLASTETELLAACRELKPESAQLVQAARAGEANLTPLVNLAARLKVLKQEILARQLAPNKIKFWLPATGFTSHVLNELEEFELLATLVATGKPTALPLIHYHQFWLTNAAEHADFLFTNLDWIERPKRKEVEQLELKLHILSDSAKRLAELYLAFGYSLKNCSLNDERLAGFKPNDIAAVNGLTEQAVKEMKELNQHIEQLMPEVKTSTVLATFGLLDLEHFLLEQTYYLYKLAQASGQRFAWPIDLTKVEYQG